MYDERLPNGMRVVIHATDRCGPKVRLQCVFNFGSNAERSDSERGLAHVNEHMLFKGTYREGTFSSSDLAHHERLFAKYNLGIKAEWSRDELDTHIRGLATDRQEWMNAMAEMGTLHLSETDIDQISRYYGAELNAFTSLDKTSYYFEVGKSSIDPFLCILAAEMKSSRLDENHLRSEIFAVLNEMNMGNDNPTRSAIGEIRELIYASNESGHYDTIGSEVDLLELDSGTLRAFYEKHYHPWNATLFVVGDMSDPSSVLRRVKTLFAGYKVEEWRTHRDTPPHRRSDLVPPRPPRRTRTSLYHNVPSPVLLYGFRIGGSQTESEYYTPQAVAMGLGGLEGSLLNECLVHESRLATSVECFVEQYRDSGEFYILIEPSLESRSPGESHAEYEKRVNEHVHRIEGVLDTSLRQAWDPKLLSTVRHNLKVGWIKQHSSLKSMTNTWVHMMGCTQDVRMLWKDPSEVVLPVAAFCSTHLDLGVGNLVVITPRSEYPGFKRRWEAREEIRSNAARFIHENKARNRTRFPLEDAYTAPHVPMVQSYQAENFRDDRLTVRDGHTHRRLSIANPRFVNVHVRRVVHEEHMFRHTFEGVELGLVSSTLLNTPRKRAIVRDAEELGATLVWGAMGGACEMVALAGSDPPYTRPLELVEELMSGVSFDTDQHQVLFERTQLATIRRFEQALESGISIARHRLQQHILVPATHRWSFEEAIQRLTVADPVSLFERHARMWKGLRKTIVTCKCLAGDVQDREFQPSFPDQPTDVTKQSFHIERNTEQTVVALGRPGQFFSTDLATSRCLPILQVIAFHSLGSRIYHIREQTGLFYSASGHMGGFATPKHTGMDEILTRVKPQDAQHTIHRLQKFLGELRDRPAITEFELHAAKAIVANEWVERLRESNIGTTFKHIQECQNRFRKNPQDYPPFLISQTQEVTLQEINQFCQAFFEAPFLITCCVGPMATK